jgi:hypothetical protein
MNRFLLRRDHDRDLHLSSVDGFGGVSDGSWGEQGPSNAGTVKREIGDQRGGSMPKFITIGYGDRAGYERTDSAVRDAAHVHDARLQADGALIGTAGAPVQVRNHDDTGVETVPGAFLRADLPIAGFAVIEAADLEEAIQLVSATPCAVADGVVEVWPLESRP